MYRLVISTAFVLAACSGGAEAQEQEEGSAASNPIPEECRLPADDAPEMERQDTEWLELLAKCNGVLKPPRVGDEEMVEPAPDVGKTPILPPDEFPEQSGLSAATARKQGAQKHKPKQPCNEDRFVQRCLQSNLALARDFGAEYPW